MKAADEIKVYLSFAVTRDDDGNFVVIAAGTSLVDGKGNPANDGAEDVLQALEDAGWRDICWYTATVDVPRPVLDDIDLGALIVGSRND